MFSRKTRMAYISYTCVYAFWHENLSIARIDAIGNKQTAL